MEIHEERRQLHLHVYRASTVHALDRQEDERADHRWKHIAREPLRQFLAPRADEKHIDRVAMPMATDIVGSYGVKHHESMMLLAGSMKRTRKPPLPRVSLVGDVKSKCNRRQIQMQSSIRSDALNETVTSTPECQPSETPKEISEALDKAVSVARGAAHQPLTLETLKLGLIPLAVERWHPMAYAEGLFSVVPTEIKVL